MTDKLSRRGFLSLLPRAGALASVGLLIPWRPRAGEIVPTPADEYTIGRKLPGALHDPLRLSFEAWSHGPIVERPTETGAEPFLRAAGNAFDLAQPTSWQLTKKAPPTVDGRPFGVCSIELQASSGIAPDELQHFRGAWQLGEPLFLTFNAGGMLYAGNFVLVALDFGVELHA